MIIYLSVRKLSNTTQHMYILNRLKKKTSFSIHPIRIRADHVHVVLIEIPTVIDRPSLTSLLCQLIIIRRSDRRGRLVRLYKRVFMRRT